MDKNEISLLLSQNINIGPRTLVKLRQVGLSKLADNPEKILEKLTLKQKIKNEIRSSLKGDIQKIKNNLQKNQIHYLTYYDKNYPKLLKQIYDPPQIIYYMGDLSVLEKKSIAIVGSRKCSAYGAQTAREMAKKLVGYDFNIVSGLALGIDGQAHLGALDGDGITTAILGNGLPMIYPASHHSLAQRIIESGGLIITEFPVNAPSYPAHFPMRNRIIAGISQATLVVEATRKSGSLITSALALDYNRDVMAIPHNISSIYGEGANHLIKNGAIIITKLTDILNVFGIEENARKIIYQPSNELEEQIIKIIKNEPTSIDKLIEEIDEDISRINSQVVLMEINGIIKDIGGKRYELQI